MLGLGSLRRGVSTLGTFVVRITILAHGKKGNICLSTLVVGIWAVIVYASRRLLRCMSRYRPSCMAVQSV